MKRSVFYLCSMIFVLMLSGIFCYEYSKNIFQRETTGIIISENTMSHIYGGLGMNCQMGYYSTPSCESGLRGDGLTYQCTSYSVQVCTSYLQPTPQYYCQYDNPNKKPHQLACECINGVVFSSVYIGWCRDYMWGC